MWHYEHIWLTLLSSIFHSTILTFYGIVPNINLYFKILNSLKSDLQSKTFKPTSPLSLTFINNFNLYTPINQLCRLFPNQDPLMLTLLLPLSLIRWKNSEIRLNSIDKKLVHTWIFLFIYLFFNLKLNKKMCPF